MFVIGNFISAAANVLDIVLTALFWLIFIRAIISWVNPDPFNMIVQFLYKCTEPILEPIRRILPFKNMGVDISPVIVFLLIVFVKSFLVRTLMEIAIRIQR